MYSRNPYSTPTYPNDYYGSPGHGSHSGSPYPTQVIPPNDYYRSQGHGSHSGSPYPTQVIPPNDYYRSQGPALYNGSPYPAQPLYPDEDDDDDDGDDDVYYDENRYQDFSSHHSNGSPSFFIIGLKMIIERRTRRPYIKRAELKFQSEPRYLEDLFRVTTISRRITELWRSGLSDIRRQDSYRWQSQESKFDISFRILLDSINDSVVERMDRILDSFDRYGAQDRERDAMNSLTIYVLNMSDYRGVCDGDLWLLDPDKDLRSVQERIIERDRYGHLELDS